MRERESGSSLPGDHSIVTLFLLFFSDFPILPLMFTFIYLNPCLSFHFLIIYYLVWKDIFGNKTVEGGKGKEVHDMI